jgi:hypothetical protein
LIEEVARLGAEVARRIQEKEDVAAQLKNALEAKEQALTECKRLTEENSKYESCILT